MITTLISAIYGIVSPPPRSYVEALITSMIIFGDGGLWQIISPHERINVLIRGTRELDLSLLLSLPCKDRGKTVIHKSRRGRSPETDHAGTLMLDF